MNGFGRFEKNWPRNWPTWPNPGRFKDTGPGSPTDDPSKLVNSSVTVAALDVLLARAIPVWIFPDCPSAPEDSAYIRNAVPLITGTPAGIGPMRPGDEYEITIEGIGSLKSRMTK